MGSEKSELINEAERDKTEGGAGKGRPSLRDAIFAVAGTERIKLCEE